MIRTRSLTGATTIQFLTDEEQEFLKKYLTLMSDISRYFYLPFILGMVIALMGWIVLLVEQDVPQPTIPFLPLFILVLLTALFLTCALAGTLSYLLFFRGRRNRKIQELDHLLHSSPHALSAFRKLREYDLISNQFSEFTEVLEISGNPPRWAKKLLLATDKS